MGSKSDPASAMLGHAQNVWQRMKAQVEKKGASFFEAVAALAQAKNEWIIDRAVEDILLAMNLKPSDLKGYPIDLDIEPLLPPGYQLVHNEGLGKQTFNQVGPKIFVGPWEFAWILTPEQVQAENKGKPISGVAVRDGLRSEMVLNVHFRDFLQAHPELFPERVDELCFWGTLAWDPSGNTVVAALHRGSSPDRHLVSCWERLDRGNDSHAAVLRLPS